MGRGLSTGPAEFSTEHLLVNVGTDLPTLLHRLNNQLGIILANAELLEVQLTDATHRARAADIVASALEAMASVRDVRTLLDPLIAPPGDRPSS